MLSKRIAASLLIKDGLVVQSIGFSRFLPIGSPLVSVEFLNQWGVDEILILDIGESRRRRMPDLKLVELLSKKSFVPFTVGGGVDTIEMMRALVHGGADKIAINRAAVMNPHIISEAAKIFGSQCIVVSIDARKNVAGEYEAFIDAGLQATGKRAVDLAIQCAAAGAGEILIRDIERDGSKIGFNIELIKMVTDAVSIPVIAAGGCGHPNHMKEVFDTTNASAVAVGNYFNFTEQSVNTAKAYLKPSVDVRLDTYAKYDDATFDAQGRVAKRPDSYLDKLRFEYYPKEII